MVYENKDNFSVSEISNNEAYLLLSKNVTTSENKFYLYDSTKGKRIEISQDAGNYSGSGFSNDNKSFYYITNSGR